MLSCLQKEKDANIALQILEDAGYDAWFVGGCVRDALLKRDVNDIDLASSASWKEVKELFEASCWSVRETGVKHGTITIISPAKTSYELTTFRRDGAYSDFRHPNNVKFVQSIKEDLARRDFTINAMAYNPAKGLLDPYNGQIDLRSKLIRTVGNPVNRFKEDALRIFRAFRFAAQLGFNIESDTFLAAEQNKHLLAKVSQERKRDEFCKILMAPFVVTIMRQYRGLLAPIVPEIVTIFDFDHNSPYHKYDVWEHTLHALKHAPEDLLVRMVLFFHDCGKPASCFKEGDIQHFYGHSDISCYLSRGALQRLRFSSKFIDSVCKLVKLHDMVLLPNERSIRRVLRALGGNTELFRKFIEIKICDFFAHGINLDYQVLSMRNALFLFEQMKAQCKVLSIADLAINGHDLINAGFKEGYKIGELLNKAFFAVTEEEIPNDKSILMHYLLNNNVSVL